MQNWKITLTYDGTPYHGWQVQPGLQTVQGTLAEAIRNITGETVLPQGSGRTDTGVHALAQVASFSLACPIPGDNLRRALNRILPASIRVLRLEAVGPEFHARHSAVRKTYEYRIFPSYVAGRDGREEAVCSPMLAPFVWDCRWPLDLQAMSAAAALVVGMHDFTSFAATQPDLAERMDESAPKSNIRTIFRSCWQAQDALYLYRVTGSGFLHHMVRNLVGTFT